MPRATLVVPCYNESRRLNVGAFQQFARSGTIDLILVDDGSTDDTVAVLGEIRDAAPDRVTVLAWSPNRGKAEAVRRGMQEALGRNSQYIGFWDADLATPLTAVADFVDILERSPQLEVVVGSRVRLLGRTIERFSTRHYAGRVFATAVSLILRLPVYDTQCGAKMFRATPRFASALDRTFRSRWIFDVELFARLGTSPAGYSPARLCMTVYEHPLLEWRDIAGSKLRPQDVAKAVAELVRIYGAYIWRARIVGSDLGDTPIPVAPARAPANLPSSIRPESSKTPG